MPPTFLFFIPHHILSIQLKEQCKLTLELLDTDTLTSEEPVEVEKWSEYVEKYVASDASIPGELKDYLARKSVFLPRYVVDDVYRTGER